MSTESIAKFFAEKVVFLTGVTGFLGKAILEKLLRGCPDVSKVYVLVRSKKGKSGKDRLTDILQTELFQRVRDDNKGSFEKVFPLNGDVSFEELGLNSAEAGKLMEEVSVVIHCAANVNFSASLKDVLTANVTGTKNMIEFAKRVKNLKSFVYVSTAFSNSDRPEIEETVYQSQINPHVAVKLYSEFPEDFVDSITPQLLGKQKLRYTFSKQLAENLVEESHSALPVCIVRPSIVVPAHREPHPGWIDNLTGLNAGFAAISKGVLRVYFTNKRGTIDFVPVDHVANLTLAAAMAASAKSKNSQEILVYNYSSTEYPFTIAQLKDYIPKAFKNIPFNEIIWYPSIIFVGNRMVFLTLDFLFHYVPVLIADGVLTVLGKGPEGGLLKLYKKMKKLLDLTYELTMSDYNISTENTKALYMSLSPNDQEDFNFDLSTINHEEFVQNSMHGYRRSVCGEEDKDLPAARANLKRYRRYYLASWSVLVLIAVVLIRHCLIP